MKKNRIYLDNCCYNRPFDDQTITKNHIESETVLMIVNQCKQNNDEIIGSSALDFEIEQITDDNKKEKVKYFYEQTITTKIDYTDNVLKRFQELSEQTNIGTLDLLHLSLAENSDVDALLTTDYKFEKASSKLNLKIKVINPLQYLLEVIQNESNY